VEERVQFFEQLEHRFAVQSRVSTLIVGASGYYLVQALDLWSRFGELRYWWMHAMVGVWAIFTVMLFVLEPLVLHRWFRARAQRDPAGTFTLVLNLHRALLAVSLVTVLGATAGVHGYSLFG
jgi:membrane protein YdbS with pleckstrin-like domain